MSPSEWVLIIWSETFVLVINPLFFSLFGYPYIVFSNESAGI